VRVLLDARTEHTAGISEVEETAPDPSSLTVHLSRRRDERSALIRVDERGREERIVNDVPDCAAAEKK
jgi:hypothetical protein